MAFAIVVAVVAVIALIFGGKLNNLKNVRFRHSWLVLVAVAVKVITNSSLRHSIGITDSVAPKLYILSFLLIVVFIGLNINLKGLALVGLGMVSNFLAIIFNNGYMPVKSEYYRLVASVDELEKINQGLPVFNHIATGPDTKLYYLTDIFLMPHWILITRVFSIGDVILTIGGAVFVWNYLRSSNKQIYT